MPVSVIMQYRWRNTATRSTMQYQGCSLGLERLGLETGSRRFLERLGLVSVLRVTEKSLTKHIVSCWIVLATDFPATSPLACQSLVADKQRGCCGGDTGIWTVLTCCVIVMCIENGRDTKRQGDKPETSPSTEKLRRSRSKTMWAWRSNANWPPRHDKTYRGLLWSIPAGLSATCCRQALGDVTGKLQGSEPSEHVNMVRRVGSTTVI